MPSVPDRPATAPPASDRLADDFERAVAAGDDSAARAILAAGRPIHLRRVDTPRGHVVRRHPDGREELVQVFAPR